MAKAGDDTTITWRDAVALVEQVHGSTRLAEEELVEWLSEDRIKWSCKRFKRKGEVDFAPSTKKAQIESGTPEFWVLVAAVQARPSALFSVDINTDEGSALVRYTNGPHAGAVGAYGITVSRADLVAQLPEAPSEDVVASLSAAQAPSSSAGPRRRYRRGPVDGVVTEFWRTGVPERLSTVDALKILGDELDRRGIDVPSPTTLLRALGRRR